jgi:hypothetical protein
MFQQFIAIFRWSYYLRIYSYNICVVDVYGLEFVQCGQLQSELDRAKRCEGVPASTCSNGLTYYKHYTHLRLYSAVCAPDDGFK